MRFFLCVTSLCFFATTSFASSYRCDGRELLSGSAEAILGTVEFESEGVHLSWKANGRDKEDLSSRDALCSRPLEEGECAVKNLSMSKSISRKIHCQKSTDRGLETTGDSFFVMSLVTWNGRFYCTSRNPEVKRTIEFTNCR